LHLVQGGTYLWGRTDRGIGDTRGILNAGWSIGRTTVQPKKGDWPHPNRRPGLYAIRPPLGGRLVISPKAQMGGLPFATELSARVAQSACDRGDHGRPITVMPTSFKRRGRRRELKFLRSDWARVIRDIRPPRLRGTSGPRFATLIWPGGWRGALPRPIAKRGPKIYSLHGGPRVEGTYRQGGKARARRTEFGCKKVSIRHPRPQAQRAGNLRGCTAQSADGKPFGRPHAGGQSVTEGWRGAAPQTGGDHAHANFLVGDKALKPRPQNHQRGRKKFPGSGSSQVRAGWGQPDRFPPRDGNAAACGSEPGYTAIAKAGAKPHGPAIPQLSEREGGGGPGWNPAIMRGYAVRRATKTSPPSCALGWPRAFFACRSPGGLSKQRVPQFLFFFILFCPIGLKKKKKKKRPFNRSSQGRLMTRLRRIATKKVPEKKNPENPKIGRKERKAAPKPAVLAKNRYFSTLADRTPASKRLGGFFTGTTSGKPYKASSGTGVWQCDAALAGNSNGPVGVTGSSFLLCPAGVRPNAQRGTRLGT